MTPPLWSYPSMHWPRRWQDKRGEIVARHQAAAEREWLAWVQADYAAMEAEHAELKAIMEKRA